MKELSIEELLEVADNIDKSPKKSEINPTVKRFVQKHNISAGDVKVPTYCIYYLYRTLSTAINKVSKIEFFRAFKQLFTLKRIRNQRYYMLNEFVPITEELLQKSLAYDISRQRKHITKRASNEKKIAE